jgi:hypothetical protein
MLSARAAKGEFTPAIENRPILLPGLDFYFTAYRELRYDRPIGMTLGPIPWSSVVRWGELHGLDVDEIGDLEYCIRAMEQAVSDFQQQREQKKSNVKGAGNE